MSWTTDDEKIDFENFHFLNLESSHRTLYKSRVCQVKTKLFKFHFFKPKIFGSLCSTFQGEYNGMIRFRQSRLVTSKTSFKVEFFEISNTCNFYSRRFKNANETSNEASCCVLSCVKVSGS